MGSLASPRNAADVPDAPLGAQIGAARQAWDESRMYGRCPASCARSAGGKESFPIGNFRNGASTFFLIPCRLVSAVQNRTFEAGQMDLLGGPPITGSKLCMRNPPRLSAILTMTAGMCDSPIAG